MAGLDRPTTTVRAEALRVLATGAYAFAIRDLAEPFKRESGHDLSITVANAGMVARKLEAGEAFDVVLSSAASLDALAAKGRVVAATKVEVGRMRIGAAVKTGAAIPDLKTVNALRAILLAAPTVAYIDPHGGGSTGPFFEKLFERLGVAEQVHAKAVLGATGADIVRALSSGRASLGLTQASELIGTPSVSFADVLPEDAQLTTVYSAVVSANARAPDAAEAFIHFVTGPVGLERLRKSGWDVAAPQERKRR
jgi:molybdate transport system substrate-binding protein